MQYKKVSSGFVLRFLSRESLSEKLLAFCEKEKVFSGALYGIGALEKAELGFFSYEKKAYETKVFEEDLEVLSFAGNISVKEEKPFVHAHVVLGRKDFSLIGGHFVSGIVGVTLELLVEPLKKKIERKKQENGLFLLDLE